MSHLESGIDRIVYAHLHQGAFLVKKAGGCWDDFASQGVILIEQQKTFAAT
jgi:hypothetical protein